MCSFSRSIPFQVSRKPPSVKNEGAGRFPATTVILFVREHYREFIPLLWLRANMPLSLGCASKASTSSTDEVIAKTSQTSKLVRSGV
jgi:hypothetical protein